MKNIIIKPNVSIIEAMRILNKTAEKCLFVVDKNEKFLGTLTDGDLRRCILEGNDFRTKIKKIYNRNPVFLQKGIFKKDDVKQLMLKKKIEVIPVINKNKIITDYYNYEKLFRDDEDKSFALLKKINVVIMAGGKGTRLAPYTEVLPKPLLPLKNKTVIETIIEKFTKVGIKNFYLTLNYKALILKSYFKELNPNYSIKYVEEKKPLGTAGSLKLLKDKIQQSFFVVNCDTIINTKYINVYKFHNENKYDITLVVSLKEHKIPYGICVLNNRGELNKIEEKPKQNLVVNTGFYILNPRVLKLIPSKKIYDLTDLIKDSKKMNLKIGVYPIDEDSWVDVGQLKEYKTTLENL